jgi:hypothetical protein
VAALRIVLFAFGYPASIIVILRFIPVVRERRLRWLVVHHIAVAAIVVGWITKGDVPAIVVNSAWLVVSSAWYVLGGRRRERSPDRSRLPAGG